MRLNSNSLKSTFLFLLFITLALQLMAYNPSDLENLKATKKCSYCDLRDADLSGMDLSLADFYKANLQGVNLKGANLYGVSFWGANLTDANLTAVEMDYAVFTHAKIIRTNFDSARGLACFYRAEIRDANLKKMKYSTVFWISGGICKVGDGYLCVEEE